MYKVDIFPHCSICWGYRYGWNMTGSTSAFQGVLFWQGPTLSAERDSPQPFSPLPLSSEGLRHFCASMQAPSILVLLLEKQIREQLRLSYTPRGGLKACVCPVCVLTRDTLFLLLNGMCCAFCLLSQPLARAVAASAHLLNWEDKSRCKGRKS